MQFNAPAAPLGIASNGGLFLDDTAYKRIPARLTAMKSVSIGDNQPAQLRFAFIQQVFDPTTGLYSDFTSGLIGDGVLCYCTELNNGSIGPLTATIPATAGTGPLVWLRSKGIVNGNKVYEFDIGTAANAWVEATTATPSQVYLGRTITDGIISGDVLESASGNFTSEDVGATLFGTNIPANTTISSVESSTTVIMSSAGTSGSGQTVRIVTGSVKGYAATIESESTKTGTWSAGTVVWLQQANDSAWLPLVGGSEPVLVPVVSGQIYQCRYFTTDASNVQIWTVAPVTAQLPYQTATVTSVALSTSWANTGLFLTLPANTTWFLQTQLAGSLTSSGTGSGDCLSARYYDGSTTYGAIANFCTAPCDTFTEFETASLTALISVGGSPITVNVQMEIITTSASTGTLTGGVLVAKQWA